MAVRIVQKHDEWAYPANRKGKFAGFIYAPDLDKAKALAIDLKVQLACNSNAIPIKLPR